MLRLWRRISVSASTHLFGLDSRLWPDVGRQTLQEAEAGGDACKRIDRAVLLDEEMLRSREKRRADDLLDVQDTFAQFHRRAVCSQVLQVHEQNSVRAVLQALHGV